MIAKMRRGGVGVMVHCQDTCEHAREMTPSTLRLSFPLLRRVRNTTRAQLPFQQRSQERLGDSESFGDRVNAD